MVRVGKLVLAIQFNQFAAAALNADLRDAIALALEFDAHLLMANRNR